MLQELNVDTRFLDTELERSLEQFKRLVDFYKRMGQAQKAQHMEFELNLLEMKIATRIEHLDDSHATP